MEQARVAPCSLTITVLSSLSHLPRAGRAGHVDHFFHHAAEFTQPWACGHFRRTERGSLLFSSSRAAVKATMTKKPDGFSDVLATEAGGLSMSIYSSRAVKFYSKSGSPTKESKKYMHLNIKFDQGLPKNANGVFTELAGTKVLSEATRALLMPPRTALSPHRIKKDGAGAFLVK